MQGRTSPLRRKAMEEHGSHLIPTNHILYKIKQSIDFSFINKITEDFYHPNNGRPGLSPEL